MAIDEHRIVDIITEKYSQCPSLASQNKSLYHAPTGITPLSIQAVKQFKIVPNPNNGEMWLQSNDNFEPGSTFMIIDLAGRMLYKKIITEETNNIQLITSGLQNGIYLYNIVSPQGKMLAKDRLVIMK